MLNFKKIAVTPFYVTLIFLFMPLVSLATAGQTYVAVAANFTPVAKEIATAFSKKTGHRAILSFGSTGKLYTQILHGAPFEIFLSADQKHTQLAIQNGFAIEGSRFTYATGQLVLYSAHNTLVDEAGAILSSASFRKIAMANSKTAPYGIAAQQVMTNLNVQDLLRPKIVRGDNIAQTYQFVATRNADLGFVALSQIIHHTDGSRWMIPKHLYAPLRQEATLLNKAKGNIAAMAFYAFLKSPIVTKIVIKYGYLSEAPQ